MKVLFVLPEFEPHTAGGICTYYRELLSENKEWKSTVIQGSAFDMRDHTSSWKGIPVHYLTKTLFNKYKALFNHLSIFPELQNHLASAWAMYEQIQNLSINFDAVVCTDWGFGFVPWIINKNVPVIVHLHGSCGQIDHYEPRYGLEFWSKLYLHIEASLLEKADALVTHSRQNIVFWGKRFSQQKTIELIPPAFGMIDEGTGVSPPVNNKTGLVIGRVQLWKGPVLLCKAIESLSSADKKDLTIYWIGRDTFYDQQNMNMTEYLKREFPEIWGKIIIPLGSKSHTEINEFIRSTSWGLVPSEWDMFNLSAIEHLKNKNPIVCSSAAGVSGFISDNPGTIIFHATAGQLANSIQEICNKTNEELRLMGTSGHELATTIFESQTVQSAHKVLFLKLNEDFSPGTLKKEETEWLLPVQTSLAEEFDPSTKLLKFWSIRKTTKILSKKIIDSLTLRAGFFFNIKNENR